MRPGRPGQGGNTSTSSVSIKTNDTVAVKDAAGNTLFETTAYWDTHNNGRSASYVLFSSPELTANSSCTLYVNDTSTGTGSSGGTSGWSLSVASETLQAAEETKLTSNVSQAEQVELEFTYDFSIVDEAIATISDTGLLTGVKRGTTTAAVKTYVNGNLALTEEYPVRVYREWPFVDVVESDWYYDPIEYVYDLGIMTGMSETIFGPVESLSRAQFAVIIYRMSGAEEVEYTPVFPDVAEGIWYADAVIWANENGIVTGYTDVGLFRPEQSISREQIAVMLHRYAKYLGIDNGVRADFSEFKDAFDVSEYAYDAMRWAVGNGIIKGKEEGTIIDPLGNAARAECATMIMRFIAMKEAI